MSESGRHLEVGHLRRLELRHLVLLLPVHRLHPRLLFGNHVVLRLAVRVLFLYELAVGVDNHQYFIERHRVEGLVREMDVARQTVHHIRDGLVRKHEQMLQVEVRLVHHLGTRPQQRRPAALFQQFLVPERPDTLVKYQALDQRWA